MRRHAFPLLAALAAVPLAAATTPAGPVETLDTGLARIESMAAQPFPARYAALAPAVDQAFALPQILQTIVGLGWGSVPAEQKTRLAAAFRAYTIANYVANFNSNSGDTFRTLPGTRQVGADTVVSSEIVPKSGAPTRIDYVVRQGGAGWQIVDVLPEGTISQVAVQRSDFRSLMSPGDASRLIAKLQEKVGALSGGTVTP